MGIEDRVEIETGLAERRTATEIASRIGCVKTTVSREVKGHCSVERKGAYGRSFNLLLRYRIQGVPWTDYGQHECLLLRYREGLDKLTCVFEDELSGSVLDNRLLDCCWLFSCIHINIWRRRMCLMLFVSPRFPTAVAWEPYVLMTYFMKFSFSKVIFHENWLVSGRFSFRL